MPRTGAKPRRLTRIILLALLLAAAAAATVMILRGRSAPPDEDPALTGPAPVPLADIRWPPVRPEAAPALREARASLERALQLYGEGDLPHADALVASSLGDIERSGALVPALGGYHYKTVESAASRSDFGEAERRAGQWLAKFPDDFQHLFVLGKIRYQLRRWAQAAEAFRRAAAEQPSSVETLRWLSQTCAQMGAQEEAVRVAKESLARIGFPGGDYWSHTIARQVLGNAIMVLHRFQEYDLLAAVAAGYLQRFPDHGEAIMAEGVALANVGRYAEAEPLLLRARADPANAENAEQIDFALGLALSKQGKWAEAAQVLTSLLEAAPFYSKGYYQLGLALERLGRSTLAEAMISKSRELAPSERELRREKELRGAGQPGRAAVAASLGYSLRGEPGRAEQVLRAPDLQSDPHGVFGLADLYLECIRPADAEKALERAASLVGPGHPDVTARQALASIARGEKEKGIALLRAAAEREAGEPVWRLKLAWILLDDGRPEEAAAILEPLRRGDADREASFLLARALLERQEPDAARALQLLRSISTGDTRWENWEGGAWLALALLAGLPSPAAVGEAARLLSEAPPASRKAEVFLRARVALLERQAHPPPEIAAARQALERYRAAGPGIASLRRQVASVAWHESPPLSLALAKLLAARGEMSEAVRHARLALLAAPGSVEALRALEGWLSRGEDVVLRLRVLRDLAKLAPGDPSVRERIEAIEKDLTIPRPGP